MRILADENVARDVVAWLRTSGHDVLFAAEAEAGAPDILWAARAEQEQRVILTSDKDFGELVFRDGLASHGIVLLRLDDLTVAEDECGMISYTWGDASTGGNEMQDASPA